MISFYKTHYSDCCSPAPVQTMVHISIKNVQWLIASVSHHINPHFVVFGSWVAHLFVTWTSSGWLVTGAPAEL